MNGHRPCLQRHPTVTKPTRTNCRLVSAPGMTGRIGTVNAETTASRSPVAFSAWIRAACVLPRRVPASITTPSDRLSLEARQRIRRVFSSNLATAGFGSRQDGPDSNRPRTPPRFQSVSQHHPTTVDHRGSQVRPRPFQLVPSLMNHRERILHHVLGVSGRPGQPARPNGASPPAHGRTDRRNHRPKPTPSPAADSQRNSISPTTMPQTRKMLRGFCRVQRSRDCAGRVAGC